MPGLAQPTFSILVPTLNSERYLGRALDSVLEAIDQSGCNAQVLVQDAGSTDGTLRIARAHPVMCDVVSEPDAGQPDGVRRALKRATGNWTCWLNSDDLILPNAFTAVCSAAMGNPAVQVVHGGYLVIDAAGRVVRAYAGSEWSTRRLFREGNYIFSGATWFTVPYLTRLGINTRLEYVFDLDLFLRVDPAIATCLPEPLAAFRYWNESKSGSQGSKFVREAWQVRRAHRARIGASHLDLVRAQSLMAFSQATLGFRRTRMWASLRASVSGTRAKAGGG